tara:strand:+ start:1005 stop:1151 length:147 start_codon:yes stop_codon:yes gene_type:complete
MKGVVGQKLKTQSLDFNKTENLPKRKVYFWIHDLESFIEENLELEEAC